MKTRVLIVDQALEFGGSIVSTANLIRGIDRERFEIVFISATNSDLVRSKLREAADITPVVIARKRIHYNNLHRFWPGLRRSRNRLLNLSGVLLLCIARLFANAQYMVRVARCIRRYRIDVVQLNNGIDDEVAMVSCAFGVRMLAYSRGYIPLSRLQRQLFAPRIDYLFAVSDFVRQQAIDDGFAPERVIVATPPAIAEAVDPARLTTLRRQHQLADDECCVGIFGRIIPWKGQREFAEAAKRVLQGCPRTRFFIIGETTDRAGDYFRKLNSFLRESGIEERFSFTGYVDEVYDYYELMDLVVHCSVLPEPSGRVIFEAMSQGKPVIASSLGGPAEFIEHGIDGYLVDPCDAENLALTIREVIDNPELAQRLGERGRNKIERLYNKDIYARLLESYYRASASRKLPALGYQRRTDPSN